MEWNLSIQILHTFMSPKFHSHVFTKGKTTLIFWGALAKMHTAIFGNIVIEKLTIIKSF